MYPKTVPFWSLLGSLLGALGPPLGDFWWTFAALGVAFELFVWLWASWVALGRTWEVSAEFLASFFTYFVNFNVFSMIFLLYFAQGSKIVEYSKICWEMLGYTRPCKDFLIFFLKFKRASRSLAKTGFWNLGGHFRYLLASLGRPESDKNTMWKTLQK